MPVQLLRGALAGGTPGKESLSGDRHMAASAARQMLAVALRRQKKADEAHKACADCLRGIPGYVERFEKVFQTKELTIDHIAQAIATFERTVLSGNAPYDRYKAGDKSAMSEAQVRGMNVFFNKATCDRCHIGFNFTDGSYENIGIGMDKPNPDLGRYRVTQREEDKGAFKTPTLREIEHTGPYMHDGSLKTLEEVVEHYDKGGIKNAWLNEQMKPLKLSKQEKSDLVSFMKALSGEGWQQIRAPIAGNIRDRDPRSLVLPTEPAGHRDDRSPAAGHIARGVQLQEVFTL